MIYLDNNATTIMPQPVLDAFIEWSNRGNASSSYKTAKEAREMMQNLKVYVSRLCKFNLTDNKENNDPTVYDIFYTSGASEGNATIIHSTVRAYKVKFPTRVPHVVISAVEHKSILLMIDELRRTKEITATIIGPDKFGHISPHKVESAISKNTCLVSIMHANNELGAINDIKSIGAITKSNNVPFHTDIVQTFGKNPIHPIPNNVDSFTLSFHKLNGPPAVGMLVIRRQFLNGRKLQPMIYGTQNGGFRGGTENIPGIGASYKALQLTMRERTKKNEFLCMLKKYTVESLGKRMPIIPYKKYLENKSRKIRPELEVVVISGLGKDYLCNTLMLSVVKYSKPFICNAKIKSALEAKGIIVSIGSACNTASPTASHVLYSIGADELIRKGTIRVSFGDMTVKKDVDKLSLALAQILSSFAPQN